MRTSPPVDEPHRELGTTLLRRAHLALQLDVGFAFERTAKLDADGRDAVAGPPERHFVLDRLERSSVVHVVEQIEVTRPERPRTAAHAGRRAGVPEAAADPPATRRLAVDGEELRR